MFFTLFGAVAVVGVLGAGIMSTMRGPLTTMVEVNRIEETKAEMAVGLRLILLSPNPASDGDVLTEPAEPAACAGAPTGAGCIPATASAKKKDAWGTSYAYCAWNNGSDHAAMGAVLSGGVSTNNVAVALISAGPDRKFQTTCSGTTFLTPSDGGGDDIIRKYNYNDAVAGSEGLWALQAGADGDEARIEEEINVGGGTGAVSTFEGGATFGNNLTTTGNVQADVVGPNPDGTQDFVEFTHGILLGDTDSCTDGMLRIRAGKLELCLGGAWDEVGKALWIEDANGMRNDDALAANVGIGTGSSATYKLYVNGGTATDTLKATSTVDFDATLNVDGAVTLKSTAGIDGAATLGSTLDVTGATKLADKLEVTKEADLFGDLTVNSDVIIKKVSGAKGNLTVEDKITASEGDITATAGNVVATAGNIEAVAGDVKAGQDLIAQRHVQATTGDITADAGNISATSGNVTAGGDVTATGKVTGGSFFRDSDNRDFSDLPAGCDAGNEKLVWTASGWDCDEIDFSGDPGDGSNGLSLKDILGYGNDADGKDAEDFGKIGADEFCDAGLGSCVSSAELIAGSTIWKMDGPGAAQGEIYYNAGSVGIGTNDPGSKLHVHGSEAYPSGDSILLVQNTAANGTGTAWVSLFASDASGYISAFGSDAHGALLNDSIVIGANSTASGGIVLYNGDYLKSVYHRTTGNFGIGVYEPVTRLDVAGTVKIGNGTELCNVTDHEGALRYVAATDKFEMCRDSSVGWEELGAGSGGGSGGGGGTNIAFRAASDGTQAIPSGSSTYVVFENEINEIGGNNYNPATGVYTVPEDGFYHFSATTRYVNGVTGLTSLGIHTSAGGGYICFTEENDTVGDRAGLSCSGSAQLTAGSIVRVVAHQSSGSGQNLGGGYTQFAGFKVGGGTSSGGSGGGGHDVSFNVYQTAVQSIPNSNGSTSELINFDTKRFDSANAFDLTNDRFTPTVAGKYVLSAAAGVRDLAAGRGVEIGIFKNGAPVAWGSLVQAGLTQYSTATVIVDANGTTDYFEAHIYQNDSVPRNTTAESATVYFSGALINGGAGGSGPVAVSYGYKYETHNSVDLWHAWFGPGQNFRNCVPEEYFQTTDFVHNSPVPTDILPHVLGVDRTLWPTHPEHDKFLRDFDPAPAYPPGHASYGAWSKPKYGPSILYRCEVDEGTGSLTVDVPGGGGGDSLAGLTCTSGQVAQWDGTAWACGNPGAGSNAAFAFNASGTATASSGVLKNFATVAPNVGNAYDNAAGRFTATEAGTYFFSASTLPNSGGVNSSVSLVKNGAGFLARAYMHSTEYTSITATAVATLDVGDYVEVVLVGTPHTNAWHSFSGFSIGGGGGGSDTLAALSCTTGQIAKWNGTAWACAADDAASSGGGTAKGLVVATSTTSLPTSAETDVTFGVAPSKNDFGAGAWTSNKLFTVPAGEDGWYNIVGTASINVGANTRLSLYVKVNGNNIALSRDDNPGMTSQYINASGNAYLAEGDTVSLSAYQNSGSAAALSWARLSLVKISGGGGSDTLAALSCSSGQVAAWNGTAWACSTPASGGSLPMTSFFVRSVGANVSGGAGTNFKNFASIDHNIGNAYNNTTGVFTAPRAGVYHFTGSALIDDPDSAALIIRKNGANSAASYQHGPEYNGMSITATLQLAAGDTVDLYGDETKNSTSNAYYFTFGGYQIGGGSDTLAGLSCASGQVAGWNGTAWACANMGSGGGGTEIFVSATRNTQTTHNGGANFVITGLTESIDTANAFAGNTFTVPETGYYFLSANVQGIDVQDGGYVSLGFLKNGNSYLTDGGSSHSPSNSADVTASGATVAKLSEGDTIQLSGRVYYNGTTIQGVSLTIFALNGFGGTGESDTLAALSCTTGQVAAWSGTAWACANSGGDSLWSDSGNGYIEYSVVDAGVKLQNIDGLTQPALALAPGATWMQGSSTLHIDGNITYTGTVTDISDRRLKTDIESLVKHGSMLDRINAIDTYSFRMKDSADTQKEFGVMAQELEEVFPELVRTATDEIGTKSVNYMGLIAPLIEATKELSSQNAALKADNRALVAENVSQRQATDARFMELEAQISLLNGIIAEQATKKASSEWLWLMLAIFGSLGVVSVLVFAGPRSHRRHDR